MGMDENLIPSTLVVVSESLLMTLIAVSYDSIVLKANIFNRLSTNSDLLAKQ